MTLLAVWPAAAQGPFGVSVPEPSSPNWGGPFAPIFRQIAIWQSDFYQQLTASLSDLKDDGTAFLVLAAVSFAYGVFHAAGPGHGKAVVTSYLLASNQTLRRGIVISFAAAFVQALTAILIVGILAGILNVTSVVLTDATRWVEIASYALIAAVGIWLLWTRIRGHRHTHAHGDHGAAHAGGAHDQHTHSHDHDHDHHHDHVHMDGDHGHSHAPDPALLRAPLTWRSAAAAVLAVGIRPCSGAIIVLVFALAQGLFLAGIGATFVMAIGTAITVSALAGLAVLARDFAVRLSGGGARVALVLRGVEIAAALVVLILGLLLLGGALAAGA